MEKQNSIKEAIKEGVAFLFRFSGIPYFIKKVICDTRTTIILYHNPSAEVFEKHLVFILKHFNIISLDKLVNAIYKKDWSDIPQKSLVITIDDGFKENYNLLKVMERFKVRATIYICSHIVNTKRKFWFTAGAENPESMMEYENQERLNALRREQDFSLDKEFSFRQALSLGELNEMSSKIDFQSHSKFHPVLPKCSDLESRLEIEESKRVLEELLKKPVEHFSFPNGDYGNREINYLKNSGYRSARTIDLGWNDMRTDPFRLKAMGIQDNASINILSAQIYGFFGYLRFLTKGSFKGAHPPYA